MLSPELTMQGFVDTSTEGLPMLGSSSYPSAPDFREPLSDAQVIEVASTRLIAMFGLQTCWFELFPFDAQLPRIEPGRIVLPAAEPGVVPWSCGLGVELPVRFAGLTLGRFILVPALPTTGVALFAVGRTEAISMAARSAPRSQQRCSPN